MSPWVRIDENALEHPKILGLPDGAFRLWVQGLAHCTKYLTDGFVAEINLRTLRAYSPKREHVLIDAGLWKRVATGIQVHDFLQWNNSREHVMADRDDAKDRMRRYRERQRQAKVSDTVTGKERYVVTESEQTQKFYMDGYVRGDLDLPERGLEKTNGTPPRFDSNSPATVGSALAERAGEFVERYKALYTKHRKGAFYVGKPVIDFQEALELVRTWDDERLEKIATVFLTTDHEFAESGSRTIGQFRALASWCDGKLREAGL